MPEAALVLVIAADWATGYEFTLAKDTGFTSPVVTLTLSTTTWGCDRDLEYGTNYFWRVRAVSATSQSLWGNSSFTTVAAPAPPPAVTTPAPVTTLPPVIERGETGEANEYLPWLFVGIVVLLLVGLIVLTVATGRRY